MKKKILLCLSFCFVATIAAQNEISDIDSLLNQTASKKTTRLKKIKIGSRKTGTAYFYLKSTNEVYSVAARNSFYNSAKHRYSSSEYKYFFLKDKLVKVIHSRAKSSPFSYGYTYLYFKDGKCLERKEFEDYPITNIEYVIAESVLILSKAIELRRGKN